MIPLNLYNKIQVLVMEEEGVRRLITTGLIFRAINGKDPKKLIQALKNGKKHGFDINGTVDCSDGNKMPIFHTALASNCDISIIKILIKNGANVNAPNALGHLPLHICISSRNYTDLALLLIENGADVNALSVINNKTALIRAIENDCTEIAIALIKKGADINQIIVEIQKDTDGEDKEIYISALITAIIYKNIDVINELIKCNVSVDYIVQFDTNVSELAIAISNKYKPAIKAIINYYKKNGVQIFKKETKCICDKKTKSLCSICNTAKYCSKECQEKAWPIHRLYCKYI